MLRSLLLLISIHVWSAWDFTFISILLYRSLYGKEMLDTCLSTIANFAFWIKYATQIYVNPIHFEIQLILKITLFLMRRPDDQNRWNWKNCPKFFHKVIFALWYQICNPNLCKSNTFWNTANIEKWPCFANWWNLKNYPKFFHRVIFAFWMQNCNPNLCKSNTFWNTANIEKWPCFTYRDLMTKIDEIGKIAGNSFIG